MQFFWKYIDDLVGKGLEWYTVLHLIFFALASFVPLALPISTLLSMLMTMGSLGEHYELTALKTAGVSLMRIMRPLMISSILISLTALYFANYVLPVANLKFGSLLYDIQQQKPALNIQQGIFYNGIAGYSIRVGRKAPDNKTIYDILIYDQTNGRGNDDVIYATRGEMHLTADKRYLIFMLYDGNEFQEVPPSDSKPIDLEQIRVTFKQWQKVFDMSQFKLSRTNEDLFKDNNQMLNMKQLDDAVDTFSGQLELKYTTYKNYITPYYNFMRPDVRQALLAAGADTIKNDSTFYSTIPPREKLEAIQSALSSIRSVKAFASIMGRDVQNTKAIIVNHKIEWWQKITLSISCFILFLVGAPLGAIVRKGGIGLPIVVAILMFILLYIILIIGKKLATDLTISPFLGTWLPNLVLLPLGIFLTYKATNDSQVFNIDIYINFFRRLFTLFTPTGKR